MLAINRNPLQTVIGQNEPTQDFLGIANVLSLDARGSSAKGDRITGFHEGNPPGQKITWTCLMWFVRTKPDHWAREAILKPKSALIDLGPKNNTGYGHVGNRQLHLSWVLPRADGWNAQVPSRQLKVRALWGIKTDPSDRAFWRRCW
jgi:hypothetical protein